MTGSYRRRGCICKVKKCVCNKSKCICKVKKCNCGAKWSYRIEIGIDPKTGNRKQKEKGGFKTKADAVAAAVKLYNDLMNGTYVAEKNTLFKDFAEQWLKIYENSGNVKISSVGVRKINVNRMLKYFAHRRMKDITRKMYQEMLDDLHLKGYAKESIVSTHAAGKMLFNKAIEFELIKVNPTQHATVPKRQQTVEELEQETEIPKFLEKDELKHFLEVAKTHGMERDYLVFVILAYTGMRIGELCALKWKDIDETEGTISITKTYHNPKNNTFKYVLLPPKTKSSRRVIDIDKFVIKQLKLYRTEQKRIRVSSKVEYYDKDFVIAKTKNNPGYPEFLKTFEDRMHRLLKLAKLNQELTPHSLRHTHTSLLAEAGVELQEIMERLGHKNDIITKTVYLHVTKTMKREAAQKFSEFMQSL